MAATDARECHECNGTGGTRAVQCRLCRGHGYIVRCALCGGAGFRRVRSPGPGATDGDGAVSCGRCRQTGSVPLPYARAAG